MVYSQAIQFLYDLRWFGTKFGLANTFKLASLAGNPQQALRFIHVAGTNGKGSTCAMLESIYRAAGLRVGLFTSPHLVSFGERIQVNRAPISELEIVKWVVHLQTLLKEFPPDEHPTFFEVVTVMALLFFRAERCDLVIWETGLGGRLDATNIVTPLASVITNIHYDHQKFLGETLGSIAAEKAGIIKQGVPVITGADQPEAFKVIEQRAHELDAPLIRVTAQATETPLLRTMQMPLLGRHQRQNALLALATAEALAAEIPVAEESLRRGLAEVRWAGRLQLVASGAGQRILLDGAHNVAGVESLVQALQEYFPGEKWTVILGVLQDKDCPGICRLLAPIASRIALVPVSSERTASPQELQRLCRQVNPQLGTSLHPSLPHALQDLACEPQLLVTGSLYLVGEALALLQTDPAPDPKERELNLWTVRK